MGMTHLDEDPPDAADDARADQEWLLARTCGICTVAHTSPEMHQTGDASWEEGEPRELAYCSLLDEDGYDVSIRICGTCARMVTEVRAAKENTL